MLTREDLYHAILMIVPDAKFSYWPDDNREATWDDDTVDYVKMDGWCIAWKKDNSQRCPELSQLQTITKQSITDEIAKRDKEYWVGHYAKDLTMIASFEVEKKTNPAMTFKDYVDDLKVKQQSVLADIANDVVNP